MIEKLEELKRKAEELENTEFNEENTPSILNGAESLFASIEEQLLSIIKTLEEEE